MEEKERIDETTPTNIIQLFLTPYIEFSKIFGDKEKTLLDCACGNQYQRQILVDRFRRVTFVDKMCQSVELESVNNVRVDLDYENLPFDDNTFDVVFSFETIEHLGLDRQKILVDELLRVSKKIVVIGSVSTDGPSYVGDELIFKKSLDCNPFHYHEFSSWEWKEFFDGMFRGHQYYHLALDEIGFQIKSGLDGKNGYCNYVVIEKRGLNE